MNQDEETYLVDNSNRVLLIAIVLGNIILLLTDSYLAYTTRSPITHLFGIFYIQACDFVENVWREQLVPKLGFPELGFKVYKALALAFLYSIVCGALVIVLTSVLKVALKIFRILFGDE